MGDKQVKLIYFSLGGSEVKQVSLGWKKIFGVVTALFSILLLLVALVLGAFTDIYHNWQVSNLSKANRQLQVRLDEMKSKIQDIQAKVQSIEKNDEDLRVFADLPQIDPDVRQLGVGGTVDAAYEDLTAVPKNEREQAIQVQRVLDNLAKRVELALKSRQEIIAKFQQDQNKFKHTPSIRPVPNARVTSRFEYRLDPFTDKPKFHEGWDFSAPRGTNVLATADGKVVEVRNRYTPNRGYGKQVIIDHGYGIMTRYAHLDKILVKPGQRVTRYTVIGKVGDTGRSTAPHLHYEVMYHGKKVDPKNYILD